ncbi:MAG: tetratricopeptide repeat protein [Verrucomicrobiales bacterium]
MSLPVKFVRSFPALVIGGFTLFGSFARAQDEVPKAIPIPAPPPTPQPGDAPITRPDAEKNAIDYANLVYNKDYYDMAIVEYQNYLRKFPDGKSVDVALYRLGESLLKENRLVEAEKVYQRNLGIKGSQYVAPAAYRLASIFYNRKEYKLAAPYFAIAETSPKRKIQLSSGYYRARSLKLAGDTKQSIEIYQKVADAEGENDYRHTALLAIGRLQAESKNNEAALTAFAKLAEQTSDTNYKAEALVMAGMLSSKTGKPDDARSYFEQAMNLDGGDEWKPDAQYQLIKTFTGEGDYKKVIQIYRKGRFAVPDVLQPNMLLMVGKAFREEKRFPSAIDIYQSIEDRFPSSEEAFEGAYRKLLCFLNTKDRNLPGFVDHFSAKYEGRHPGHKYFDMANLMKAESLFADGSYGAAATTYTRIDVDRIPEDVRASALYKGAWAFSENRNDAQAVGLFTQFIDRFPNDERVPTALAKRGLSYRAVEDFSSALRDFRRVIEQHPESEPMELALQQTALIRGQQRGYKEMIDAYTMLLEKFPETKAKAEARFWTGWGYFELKQFDKAIGPLDASRNLDPKAYYDRATMRLILAYYSLRDVKAVRTEIDGVKSGSRVVVPGQVYAWLGVKLFEEGDYPGSDTYLTRSSTPDNPGATRAIVWKQLGMARLKTKSYKRAIAAFDYYLLSNQPSGNRAKVLLEKGHAQLGLKAYDDADRTIEEALQLEPQGRVNAQLCLAWGDVALGRKDYDAAVKRLIRPSYVFVDGEITPLALDKTILAHEMLGNDERAEEVRKTLSEKYPKYKRQETVQVAPPAE